MRIALVLACLSCPAFARADGWNGRYLAAEANLGIGSPTDQGAAAELGALPWLSVAVGIASHRVGGLLGGGGDGHVSTMARVQTPNGRLRLFAGLGVSEGPWTREDHPLGESPYSIETWDRVWWSNLEAGIAYGWSHVRLRAYGGIGSPVAEHGYACDITRSGGSCGTPRPAGLAYLGIAFGYGFSI